MQITQCPECHTAFKVSPEHLAVANGWVRCGRCGCVFEAMQHLEREEVSSSVDTTPAETTHATTSSPNVQDAVAIHKPQSDVTVSNDIDAFHDSLMTFVPASQRAASHVQEENSRYGWLWYVLSGVLSLGLVLQLVLWNRHLLVAQEPALQALIEGMCLPFGCEWHWPQTLEAVQIENSSFTENADGTYRLQLRLKNTQHHVVAMPLLELTLTDERDDVVLRRVFQPEELGLKDHMPALRDARSTLNFDLDENLKPRVMGFRALIFYP